MSKYRIVREIEAKTMQAALRREADGELVECYIAPPEMVMEGKDQIGFTIEQED